MYIEFFTCYTYFMLYKTYLKTLTSCPFCDHKDRKIVENKNAFLTYAKAPYAPHHILVVPQRHVDSFLDLTKAEEASITMLLRKGVKMLHAMGDKNCSILVRDGMGTGKSIAHLHYHIIPNHRIGDLDINGEKRKVLTQKEISHVLKELKEAL